MPLDHLWATWRSNYIRGVVDSRTVVPEGEPDDGRSLFERILHSGLADSETLILHRGPDLLRHPEPVPRTRRATSWSCRTGRSGTSRP